jgi:Synergist-CTERM protein sorting domain-containing protein
MEKSFLAACGRFSRFLVLLILLLLAPASEGAIRYVNANAGGANNGTSWANAFPDLQDALASSVAGDEIWVAAGIYVPTTGIGRSVFFVLKNGVALYGGFAGTETTRAQRKWEVNETVLSGNIGAPGSFLDNSYHVVVGSGTNNTAVLDGFTVTGGNANGSTDDRKRGGGMFNFGGSPTVRNCRFVSNHADKDGGGMFNYDGSPVVTNCTFSSNSAGEHGGGMFNWWNASSPVLVNCTFSSNSAHWGGGVCNYLAGTPKFTGCVFQHNFASGYGGGMFNSGGGLEMTDSVLSENRAEIHGGGMFNEGGTRSIEDCTFSQNRAGENGGGMYNQHAFGALTVTNSTFFGNIAIAGGGIYNWSSSNPVVTNCTFSANDATTGGGMLNTNWSNPDMMNCTFAGNRSDFGGDALYNRVGSAPAATNCIFWGYTGPGQILNEATASLTITYSITDQAGAGNIADDPKLGPLADNGGPTRTHALLDGSAALNTGTATGAPATDQRGITRPQGAGVDIGAFERAGVPPIPFGSGGGGCSVGFSPWTLLLLLPAALLVRR